MVIIHYTSDFENTRAAHKVKKILHIKIFFNNNTETEYTRFYTYFCVLFHIAAFHIKALVVPWNQFVYTLFMPCSRLVIQPASFRSSSFAKRLPARWSFFFGNREKSDGARSGVQNNNHSCLCTYHVTRSDVQLHEATFQHHTEYQKPMIGCKEIGAWTVCGNVVYSMDDSI